LIDGGPPIHGDELGRVINSDINGIEIIRPGRSTNVTNIGVASVGSLGIDVSTINIDIHSFRIPRSTGIEFESNSELVVSW
jgi:hypothetical protein